MFKKAAIRLKVCRICQQEFGCGPSNGATSCWCNNFPPILSPDPQKDCLCQECLHKEIEQKIKKYTEGIQPKEAANIDLQKYRNQENIEGIDFYLENGFVVFSKWYHLKRGYCCRNGCRHCPFGFKK